MSNFYIESFVLFVGVVTLAVAAITAMIFALELMTKAIWWALPTKGKIFLKNIEWKLEVIGAMIAVREFNFLNHISRRHSNKVTQWLRANAKANMRIAIGHAENRLEQLSLLLNGIQQ
jgi:hypothetical protein